MQLTRNRVSILVACSTILVIVFFFTAPIVQYLVTVSIPRNYGDRAYEACQSLASNSTAFNDCLRKNSLPPISLAGQNSLAYSLLSYGQGPYPAVTLITQGNESALVYFRGSSIAMAEGLQRYSFGPLSLEPSAALDIANASIVPTFNSLLNLTIVIAGFGGDRNTTGVTDLHVHFDYPGYGNNNTVDGIVWHAPLHDMNCGILPADSFVCSLEVNPNSSLTIGDLYPLRVVAFWSRQTGTVNVTETNLGKSFTFQEPTFTSFVWVQTIRVVYPGAGPNAAWVKAFVALVDAKRGSLPLSEDTSLDSFAQTRFQTALSVYSISDYGFDNQSAAYFNGTGKIATEEILYPSTFSPSAFPSYLQKYAPGHWLTLTNTAYTRYGYYLGEGPAIAVSDSCPVTEIMQRNVNITQIAIQNGCKYQVENVIYLVFVLTSA